MFSLYQCDLQALEPPSPESICLALKDLQDLGALDQNEDLTVLGKLLVKLPLDPRLAKMTLLGESLC
jgi:HrpA-like RNA helicase